MEQDFQESRDAGEAKYPAAAPAGAAPAGLPGSFPPKCPCESDDSEIWAMIHPATLTGENSAFPGRGDDIANRVSGAPSPKLPEVGIAELIAESQVPGGAGAEVRGGEAQDLGERATHGIDASIEIEGGADVVGGGDRKFRPDFDHWALKTAGTDTGDCASGEFPCTRGAVLKALVAIAQQPDEPAAKTEPAVVKKAIEELGCDSEICALNHPKFIKRAKELGVAPTTIAAEKELKFKPFGPKNSVELLNNFQIDEALQRWARTEFKDFFAHPFAMMDFHKTGDDFDSVSLSSIYRGEVPQLIGKGFGSTKRPCRTFGCILNTDVSTGPGKHWVAVFVDMRGEGEWSVEFFNSAGNPPPAPVVDWMERARAELESFRGGKGPVVSANMTKSHQRSETECGMFSLFYIRQRLVGSPRTMFAGERITDSAMMAFRQHVFRSEK